MSTVQVAFFNAKAKDRANVECCYRRFDCFVAYFPAVRNNRRAGGQVESPTLAFDLAVRQGDLELLDARVRNPGTAQDQLSQLGQALEVFQPGVRDLGIG